MRLPMYPDMTYDGATPRILPRLPLGHLQGHLARLTHHLCTQTRSRICGVVADVQAFTCQPSTYHASVYDLGICSSRDVARKHRWLYSYVREESMKVKGWVKASRGGIECIGCACTGEHSNTYNSITPSCVIQA